MIGIIILKQIIAWRNKHIIVNIADISFQMYACLQQALVRATLMAPDGKAIETWAYETRDGHAVQVLPIMHPSAAFSPDYWHEVIESFLSRD